MKQVRIYFAGPLFASYEREFIDWCARKLRAEGFEVFVPHEQSAKQSAEEREKFGQLSQRERAIQIFDLDYKGVSWANVMIALVDGTQVDDGTASEIGIFVEQMLTGQDKIAIYGLSADQRVKSHTDPGEGKGLNYFTAGAIYRVGGEVYYDIEDIIEELKK